jgi:hypothetical protein
MQKLPKSDAVNKSKQFISAQRPGAALENTTMHVPNDLNFDTETYLLFSIYYQANLLKDMDESAETFLERFEKQIRGTGQVLEWLGLATPDKHSPLGWKPSHSLMSLIATPRKRSKSRKAFASSEDNELFDMIFHAALGELEVDSNIPDFVVRVLRDLGLAKQADLDLVPTPRLRALACERRQAERDQRVVEHLKSVRVR